MPGASLAEIAQEIGVQPAQVVSWATKGQADPVWWGEFALGKTYWPKQREILYAVRDHRQVNVPACHASGKSFVAGTAVLWWNQNFVGDGISNVCVTTAPSDRQVRWILWKEIRAQHAKARFPLRGKPDTQQLQISEDHFALGFATTEYDPTKFQGLHADHIFVVGDEACGLTSDVFEGIMGVLGGGHSRLLLLGNPTDPLTQFKRDCEDPRNRTIPISSYDTPNFNIQQGFKPWPKHPGISEAIVLRERNFVLPSHDPENWMQLLAPLRPPELSKDSTDFSLPNPYLCTPNFVDSIIRRYGANSPQYMGRVLGQFPEQAENSLFTLTEIHDAMHTVDFSQNAYVRSCPLRLGVDVARMGSNQTVVTAYQGDEERGVARILGRWGKTDTVDTSTKVIEIADSCRRHGLPPGEIAIDVIGVGGGVVDYLKHKGLPITEFNSASNLDVPETFLNTRALSYYQMKSMMELRMLDLPVDDSLKSQLMTIRYDQPDGSTKLRILGKEFMKAHGIQSPDDADSVCISVYAGPRGRRDLGVTI